MRPVPDGLDPELAARVAAMLKQQRWAKEARLGSALCVAAAPSDERIDRLSQAVTLISDDELDRLVDRIDTATDDELESLATRIIELGSLMRSYADRVIDGGRGAIRCRGLLIVDDLHILEVAAHRLIVDYDMRFERSDGRCVYAVAVDEEDAA